MHQGRCGDDPAGGYRLLRCFYEQCVLVVHGFASLGIVKVKLH